MYVSIEHTPSISPYIERNQSYANYASIKSFETPSPRSTTFKSSSETSSGTSILGKLEIGEYTNSQLYFLQVCQRDTFRHLKASFNWSALGQEEIPLEDTSTHTR